jgi:cupin fold WbuC family metalloprotein
VKLNSIAIETSENVFHAQYQNLSVTSDIVFELIELMETKQKTSRLCLHPSKESLVHQSLIVTSSKFQNNRHFHPDKFETIYPLHGQARLNLFDSRLNQISSSLLSTDKTMSATIQPKEIHNFEILTETFAFLEVCPGPFTIHSTIYV